MQENDGYSHSGTSKTMSWTGPLIVLASRSILAIIFQTVTAGVFLRGNSDAWNTAGEWWRVYGTAIDLVCLVLLAYMARREGKMLFAFGAYDKAHWKRDVLIGLALGIPLLIAFAVPTVIVEMLVYKGTAPVPGKGLPAWGVVYAMVIWPVIWAFAEDNVYFGYSLPRLDKLTGKKWVAIMVVSFFASIQHIFLPWRFEWQWLVSHFTGYVIGSVIICMLYFRLRRLLPLHVAHWLLNVIAMVMLVMGANR